jgi:hypothetical protein
VQAQSKLLLTVLSVCGALLSAASSQAQPTRANDYASTEKSPVSVAGPERHPLNLISRAPVFVNDQAAGAVLAYDDPSTDRPADYFELYDSAGDLVAVGWFDRFGIRRMAVDRALIEEKNDLEGVFVTLLEGDSI